MKFFICRECLIERADDFPEVFEKFSALAGVYGYGDAQVKNIYKRIDG